MIIDGMTELERAPSARIVSAIGNGSANGKLFSLENPT